MESEVRPCSCEAVNSSYLVTGDRIEVKMKGVASKKMIGGIREWVKVRMNEAQRR